MRANLCWWQCGSGCCARAVAGDNVGIDRSGGGNRGGGDGDGVMVVVILFGLWWW